MKEKELVAPTDRFVDTGKFSISFADHVLVACVRCRTPGAVEADGVPSRWHAHFSCDHCHLQLSSAEGSWGGDFKWVGRRPCGYCGHKWLSVCQVVAHSSGTAAPASVAVSCSECGRSSDVTVKVMRAQSDDHCVDPHFGLPLLLRDQSRLGVVWAYNARHLAELRGYIQAKQRVRRPSSHQSMFSRLPSWMKLAKNRETVLKSITRIEAILSSLAP
ncbi:MAG TPA: hypothetical protein VIE43_18785 [Thermoanaerobaculia bacterium]|nr:hypothetical protein [Thermoanaerobaculia bacterium]